MSVLDHALGHPLKLEEEGSMPLAGGLISHGYQCGMLWGATLAAGAQAYRLLGPGAHAEAKTIIAAQRIIESFRGLNRKHVIDCLEITDTNWQKQKQVFKYLVKGGPVICIRMAAKYAPEAFDAIDATTTEAPIDVPSPPVSCAALLARKMGASDMHTVMAAGFAGGIGLSGGACGALGAAVWLMGMDCRKEQLGFKDVRAKVEDKISAFSKGTDPRFECSEIVGRRFKDVGDHAGYLRAGGCSGIIELLAAKSR